MTTPVLLDLTVVQHDNGTRRASGQATCLLWSFDLRPQELLSAQTLPDRKLPTPRLAKHAVLVIRIWSGYSSGEGRRVLKLWNRSNHLATIRSIGGNVVVKDTVEAGMVRMKRSSILSVIRWCYRYFCCSKKVPADKNRNFNEGDHKYLRKLTSALDMAVSSIFSKDMEYWFCSFHVAYCLL